MKKRGLFRIFIERIPYIWYFIIDIRKARSRSTNMREADQNIKGMICYGKRMDE